LRDLSEPDWRRDLASDYDVAVVVNAVHWLSVAGAAKLFGNILPIGRRFPAYGTGGAEPLLRLGSRGGKKNSQASTNTKTGGASGRE
jgi:hypothetical protein